MATETDSKEMDHQSIHTGGYGSIYDQMKRVKSMNPTEAVLTLEDGQVIKVRNPLIHAPNRSFRSKHEILEFLKVYAL